MPIPRASTRRGSNSDPEGVTESTSPDRASAQTRSSWNVATTPPGSAPNADTAPSALTLHTRPFVSASTDPSGPGSTRRGSVASSSMRCQAPPGGCLHKLDA